MRRKVILVKNNNIKKRKSKLYCFISICILIIIICSCSLIYLLSKDNGKKIILEDKPIIIEEKKYNISINIPSSNNNKYIDNLITDYVSLEKESFKDQVVDRDNSNLIIDINTYNMGNIFTIYKKEISNIDNNINTKYFINYYDSNSNQEISLDSMITNKEAYYNKLIWYTKWYISRHSDLNLYEDLSALDNYENYNLLFKESEISILFKEFVISDTEIIIPCPYTALKSFTNEEVLNLNNVVIKKIDNKDSEYYKNKKLVAFTFDDGPVAKNTNLLLDELMKRNYKVTFFVVGNLVVTYPDTIKREYDEGHTIGTHTWNHTYLSRLKTTDAIKKMVYDANDAVKNITGEDVRFFRPPGGIRNKTILKAIDMPFILWSLDTEDWRKKDTELDAISAVEAAKDGDIILFHDLHAPSIPAAIQAMDILAYDNFEFVNLDTLVILRGYNLENSNLYWSFR